MSEMRLAVLGAGGRMGRRLVRAVMERGEATLAAAAARSSSIVGQDAGVLAGLGPAGIAVIDRLDPVLTEIDGILDFTVPEATAALAPLAAAHGLVHVVGTTGLGEADFAVLRRAASEGGRVVQSGNMSLGVNVLAVLVRQAARALGDGWDIEVVEMHHRMKVDAPSGTALLLGEAAADGRGVSLAAHSARRRDGHTGARREGDIGFASLRGGTVVGEHSVILAGPGERIELGHRAEDRGLFARGAVEAALWARSRPAGYYDMADVLGLAAPAGD